MNQTEWTSKRGFILIKDNVQQTENKPTVKEIVSSIDRMQSCHVYDEKILEFLIRKLQTA